jgi:serine/threonine protein kinase
MKFPDTFGRYELIELIATGGMAHIFLAHLKNPQGADKQLVIKKILPHLLANRDFIEMFIDEARITMPLSHGNIVQVYEFGQVENDFFLAMEYVRGLNLEVILRKIKKRLAQVPIEIALYITAEVAKGLDYAHRFRNPQDQHSGIVHRDVSPQNIIVGFHAEVKLTDFGIAKAKNCIRQTSQGIIRGKACYLSPEQAECRPLDGASDQFSLANVLYEMLTGIRPFEGASEIETLDKIRAASVSPPSSRRVEISAELDQLVMKALSKDPKNRFDNIGLFNSALNKLLNKLSSDFRPTSLEKWMRDNFSDKIAQKQEKSNLPPAAIFKMNTVSIISAKQPSKKSGFFFWLSLLIIIPTIIGLWVARDQFFGTTGHTVFIEEPEDGGVVPDASEEAIPDSQPNESTTTPSTDRVSKKAEDIDIQRPPVRYGFVNLNSMPWAMVEVDGKVLKEETPLFKIRLRAGKHRLRFFNPTLKLEKMVEVYVIANQTQTVSVELKKP